MERNKHIERDKNSGVKIFDNRSLEVDYRTLKPFLEEGMRVLDVGCGTGAISKDIAKVVGPKGKVTGIDNTEKFILSGRETYGEVSNLELLHKDFYDYAPSEKFDLIVSARMFQWLNNPESAMKKLKSLLKENGTISVLDYNHEELEWNPRPPDSIQEFYNTFLKWRKQSGLNNRMAEDLSDVMKSAGLGSIEIFNSDEFYDRDRPDFHSKVGIWSKVAGSTQMVEEGLLDNQLRLKAIEEYDDWVKNEAVSMCMKLKEVRGKLI